MKAKFIRGGDPRKSLDIGFRKALAREMVRADFIDNVEDYDDYWGLLYFISKEDISGIRKVLSTTDGDFADYSVSPLAAIVWKDRLDMFKALEEYGFNVLDDKILLTAASAKPYKILDYLLSKNEIKVNQISNAIREKEASSWDHENHIGLKKLKKALDKRLEIGMSKGTMDKRI